MCGPLEYRIPFNTWATHSLQGRGAKRQLSLRSPFMEWGAGRRSRGSQELQSGRLEGRIECSGVSLSGVS